MAQNIRYGKPCMTNLPPELGRQIIDEIMNSPKPDHKALEEKTRQAMEKIKEQLEKARND